MSDRNEAHETRWSRLAVDLAGVIANTKDPGIRSSMQDVLAMMHDIESEVPVSAPTEVEGAGRLSLPRMHFVLGALKGIRASCIESLFEEKSQWDGALLDAIGEFAARLRTTAPAQEHAICECGWNVERHSLTCSSHPRNLTAPAQSESPQDGGDDDWMHQYTDVPIGIRILANRKKAGFTQMVLAERAIVTQASVSMIESGERQPSFAMAKKLLEACGARLTVSRDDARRTPPHLTARPQDTVLHEFIAAIANATLHSDNAESIPDEAGHMRRYEFIDWTRNLARHFSALRAATGGTE